LKAEYHKHETGMNQQRGTICLRYEWTERNAFIRSQS